MTPSGLPIFVSGVRAFTLLPQETHAPRVPVGRMVLRGEGWSIPAAEIPERADDVAAFARDRGMPRRVFTKSPLGSSSPRCCRGPNECWLADPDGNHHVSELRMVAVEASAG